MAEKLTQNGSCTELIISLKTISRYLRSFKRTEFMQIKTEANEGGKITQLEISDRQCSFIEQFEHFKMK